MFDSSLRHQIKAPDSQESGAFSLYTSMGGGAPTKKPRSRERGPCLQDTRLQAVPGRKCLLGCGSVSSGGSSGSVGCGSGSRSGIGRGGSSFGSGCCRCCGLSGSRSGGGSGGRCRLFLLAASSQGSSSDQGSDDERLVHFRFSLRTVKKTKNATTSSLLQPGSALAESAPEEHIFHSADDYIGYSSILNNTEQTAKQPGVANN